MADNGAKVRFSPGGARPAPAQVVASTRTELFPGVDRPTMVLWLGLALIAASELVDYGPLRTVVDAAQGKQPRSNSLGFVEAGMELGLLAFLYLLALASDNSGTVAVLILVALWVAWLVRHSQQAAGFLNPLAKPTSPNAGANPNTNLGGH